SLYSKAAITFAQLAMIRLMTSLSSFAMQSNASLAGSLQSPRWQQRAGSSVQVGASLPGLPLSGKRGKHALGSGPIASRRQSEGHEPSASSLQRPRSSRRAARARDVLSNGSG